MKKLLFLLLPLLLISCDFNKTNQEPVNTTDDTEITTPEETKTNTNESTENQENNTMSDVYTFTVGNLGLTDKQTLEGYTVLSSDGHVSFSFYRYQYYGTPKIPYLFFNNTKRLVDNHSWEGYGGYSHFVIRNFSSNNCKVRVTITYSTIKNTDNMYLDAFYSNIYDDFYSPVQMLPQKICSINKEWNEVVFEFPSANNIDSYAFAPFLTNYNPLTSGNSDDNRMRLSEIKIERIKD